MRDPRVSAFVEGLEPWMRDAAARVRDLIHEAEPAIEETIKRTDRPYFVLDGNVCALQATRDHLNVFVYDPSVPDPAGIITQGQGNATARSIQLFAGDELDAAAFRALVAAVADRNRRGGWRRLDP